MTCCLSFDDLSWIARGRPRTAAERAAQDAAAPAEWNAWVRAMAAEAGGRVGIQDRRGTNGVLHTAFWLVAPPCWSERRWRPTPGPAGRPGLVLAPAGPGDPLPGRVARMSCVPDVSAVPPGAWWDDGDAELLPALRAFVGAT